MNVGILQTATMAEYPTHKELNESIKLKDPHFETILSKKKENLIMEFYKNYKNDISSVRITSPAHIGYLARHDSHLESLCDSVEEFMKAKGFPQKLYSRVIMAGTITCTYYVS